jgi:hypothetical protein
VPQGGRSYGFGDAQQRMSEEELWRWQMGKGQFDGTSVHERVIQAYMQRKNADASIAQLRGIAVARVFERSGAADTTAVLAGIFGVRGKRLVAAAEAALARRPIEERFAFWADAAGVRPPNQALAAAIGDLAVDARSFIAHAVNQ